MINKIATFSIIILFVNISSGQIVSLVPLEYEIQDLNKDLHIYDLDITNLNSDTMLFDWTLDYSFTPTEDFRVEVWDFNIAWLTSFVTSCESSLPNKFSPHDTMSIKLLIKAKNIPTEILMQNPEINFKLSPSGDCSTTLINYVFRIVDRTVSIIDQSDLQLNVYPNPASDIINIDIPEDGKGQVIIYNNLGQVVMEKKITSVSDTENLNISSLQSGQYRLLYIPEKSDSKSVYYSGFVKM